MENEKHKDKDRKFMGKLKQGVIIPVPYSQSELPDGYFEFIKQIKETITNQRFRTLISANTAMIILYWEIGKAILERQKTEGWGAKVIDRVSYDLNTNFQI